MVIGLGVILPAAPGYVGNFEYFTLLGLALFSVGQEAAFAYALVAHICQFVPVSEDFARLFLRMAFFRAFFTFVRGSCWFRKHRGVG
jgi:hypothetical protein